MKKWWVIAGISAAIGLVIGIAIHPLLPFDNEGSELPPETAAAGPTSVANTAAPNPETPITTTSTSQAPLAVGSGESACGLGDPLMVGETPADVFDVNFDDLASSEFGGKPRGALEDAFGFGFEYLANEGGLALETIDGNRFLRQRYEPIDRGTAVTEFLSEPVNAQKTNEMWLSYKVYFEPGWEWVLGGKLPGLAGGDFPSGGKGGDGTDGFSARLMWRPGGQIVVYAYHPDRPGRFGEDFSLCGNVEPGVWTEITTRIVMNSTADSFDGIVEAWVDGQKRLSKSDVRWRTTGEFGVDRFVYSSFYGGSSREWAPTSTTFARFDDFRMSTTRLGLSSR